MKIWWEKCFLKLPIFGVPWPSLYHRGWVQNSTLQTKNRILIYIQKDKRKILESTWFYRIFNGRIVKEPGQAFCCLVCGIEICNASNNLAGILFSFGTGTKIDRFLVAYTRLYTSLCRSVGRSEITLSEITSLFWTFRAEWRSDLSYCPCPTTILPLPTRTQQMLPCIRPCF